MLAHSSASRRPARFLFIARYIVSVMYIYMCLTFCLSLYVSIHTHTYAHAKKKTRAYRVYIIINTTCLCILAKVMRVELFLPNSDEPRIGDKRKSKRHIFFIYIKATDMTIAMYSVYPNSPQLADNVFKIFI